MQITAIYEKTIYETAKDGAIIALYRVNNKTQTITGKMLPTIPDVKYIFEGEWVEHKKYGLQFRADFFTEDVSNKDGILRFLSSKLIKGIGSKTAEKIVNKFGERTMEVLDNDIEEVLNIKGFPKSKFKIFKESYQEQRSAKEVIVALSKYGIPVKLAIRVFEYFGAKTMEVIKNAPYKLCIISGITFPVVDKIGPKTYEYEHNYERFVYCANYVLYANQNCAFSRITGNLTSGSNGMQKDEFGNVMLSLLRINTLDGKGVCEMTLRMLDEKRLVYVKKDNQIYFFSTGMFNIEKETARAIERLKIQPNFVKDLDKHIANAEKQLSYEIDSKQREAIKKAFENNISIITGMPGTGKTTIILLLALIYHNLYPKNKVYLIAPSGKASARIRETVPYEWVEVSTIHIALGIQIDELNDSDYDGNVFDNALIVCDETSMAGSRLFYQLMSAIGNNCKLVISGDDEQLQSVDSGAVLRDLIISECIPVTNLTHIYRQDDNSTLYQNIRNIRQGKTNLIYDDSFNFVEESDLKKIEDEMVSYYVQKVKEDGYDKVMMLSPYKGNDAGVYNLNNKVQEILNPESEVEMRGIYKFRPNDYVMQITNDYDNKIMNGDTGRVIRIYEKDGEKQMDVLFGKTLKVYTKDNLDELHLAYAYTVHKAQGSEAKTVICCCHRIHNRFLKRNVFYTAVSRASESIKIFGEKEAFNKAIETKNTENRITVLKDIIRQYAGEFVFMFTKNGNL